MNRLCHILIVLAAVSYCTPPSLCLAQITFPDFSSIANLSLAGDASQFEDKLRLTPALKWKASAVWYVDKQFLQDGFSSTFEYQITGRAGEGDGLAFVIQNDSVSAVGNLGGYLGYGGYSPCSVALVPGIFNSLAVELDTHRNACWSEPGSNHISVQTRGILENSPSPEFSIGTTLIGEVADEIVHTMKVEYVPGSMKIYFDDSENAVLTVTVDISDFLELDNGRAFVGITSGTGGGYQNLDILSWSHDTFLPPDPCVDNDLDGYGNPATSACTYPDLDCDDTDPDMHPGMTEICDGKDNNCDLLIPSDETDDDSDGYVECDTWVGSIPDIVSGDDCDDADGNVNPGVVEGTAEGNCSDAKDNDCDELTDVDDLNCPGGGSCTGSASASTSGSTPVYGSSDLGKHLGFFLIPAGVIIAMRVWRGKR